MIEYGCGGLLLLMVAISMFMDTAVTPLMTYAVSGVAVFALASAEVNILLTRYKIMEEKLIITKGFIKQDKKSIYFHPLGFVPDINIKQGRFQRMLNYGTVFIKEGGSNSLELKNINNPQNVLKIIEERIEANRSVSSMHKEGK